MMKQLVIVFLLLISIGFTACKVADTNTSFCDRDEVEIAESKLNDLVTYFGLVIDNLDPESSNSIMENMTEVKFIREKIDNEIVPICLQDAKSYLVDSLDLYNEGLRNLVLGSADWSIESKLSESLDSLKKYYSEISRVKFLIAE